MSTQNNKTPIEAVPLIEVQAVNPEQASRTILGSLFLHRTTIFKLFFLIVYVICICYIFVNDPGKFVTNYASVFISLVLLSSIFLFYRTLKSNARYIDFKFDIIKNLIVTLCFIFLSFFFYYYNPGGYIMQYLSTPIYILLFTLGIFCILYLMLYVYSANSAKSFLATSNSADFKNLMNNEGTIFSMMKYFLLLISFISLIIIAVIFGKKAFANLSSMSTGKLAINIIIIIVFAAIVFKALTYTNFYQNSPLTQLIINSIFYIPCILVALVDNFVKLTGLDTKPNGKDSGLFKPTTTDYILLVLAILLNVAYFTYPYAAVKFSKQGGTMLIDNPIYINSEQILASYQSLNNGSNYDLNYDSTKNEDFNYTYAISFWVYIDAVSPSMSAAYNRYTSLLSYGGKPNVLYKGSDNTLMITMDNTSAPKTNYKPTVSFDIDESGNRIIYVKKDLLLQKWNNIIINYNGGTLDVFLNGELVKSSIEVVPYMKYDTLTVGSKNGIRGGICSVDYFNKNLNIQQIYYLYNFVKDNTPPVYKSSEETIKSIAGDVPSTMNKSSLNNYTNTLKDKINNGP